MSSEESTGTFGNSGREHPLTGSGAKKGNPREKEGGVTIKDTFTESLEEDSARGRDRV